MIDKFRTNDYHNNIDISSFIPKGIKIESKKISN
jgi:hypothetical protein